MKKLDKNVLSDLVKKPILARVSDGDWYQYAKEPELQAIVKKSSSEIARLNQVATTDFDAAEKGLHALVSNLTVSSEIYFPIRGLEYPSNLTVGDGSFINAGLRILSAGKVTIGAHCFIGPDVNFYTPNHSTDLELRREGWQYDAPITLGNDCWLGGNVTLLPGVTLGNNVIVGAGAVVTKDFGNNVMIAGNPAREIKNLA
ncbi:MAG: sugar O-acetyltransferase [Streptococcaceae bacterium]|nr:sugar O-acetyltransferase [Streptococcaceae bacterium]